jgi:hypothetical protein
MTIKDLAALLATLPQDALVVVASDSEGNGFSPFYKLTTGRYVEYSSGESEFHESGDRDDAEDEDAVEAVCVWPEC